MRLSAALTLAVAAPALAKSAHHMFPGRTLKDAHPPAPRVKQAQPAQPIAVPAAAGGATEVIIIWQNPGAGAATTTVAPAVTVTQTVTAGANGAVVGGATLAPGATSVVAGASATHSVSWRDG